MYVIHFEIKRSLQNGTLGGKHHNFIIFIIIRRTDAPRVAHSKTFAAARETAHHIPAVPTFGRIFEHFADLAVHIVVDIFGNVNARKVAATRLVKEPFALTVKAMAKLFEDDVSVGFEPRILTLGGDFVKNILKICHIEIAADAEVSRPPIVAPCEGMHIVEAALAGGGIAQVSEVNLAHELLVFLHIIHVEFLLRREVVEVGIDGFKNLRYRARAQRPFAKHIFLARFAVEFQTADSRRLLTTVVLFLHHQIEFVEGITPSAVLLLIIFQRLQ